MDGFPIGAAATIEELTADPHPRYDRLRASEPVSWVPVLGGWLVTGWEVATEVIRDDGRFTVDHPAFTTAQVVGPSMLSLDGPEHVRHRAPFAPPLRPSAVQANLAEVVTAAAERLIADLAPKGKAELRRDVAGPLAVGVVADLLGMIDVDPTELLALYVDIVGSVTALSQPPPAPSAGSPPGATAINGGPTARRSAVAAGAVAVARLGELVAASVDGGESMLAEAARTLTGSETAANAAVFLFGGIETSEGMTANAFWHLFTYTAAAGVASEAIVEESLRLEPAAARVDRYATADTEIGGASVRKGDLVVVSLSAANRDPEVFDDPHAFRPDRPNVRRHLAFAPGPHMCIGLHVARMETVAALEAARSHLPDLHLDHGRSAPPSGLVFRKPPAVWATWKAP